MTPSGSRIHRSWTNYKFMQNAAKRKLKTLRLFDAMKFVAEMSSKVSRKSRLKHERGDYRKAAVGVLDLPNGVQICQALLAFYLPSVSAKGILSAVPGGGFQKIVGPCWHPQKSIILNLVLLLGPLFMEAPYPTRKTAEGSCNERPKAYRKPSPLEALCCELLNSSYHSIHGP